MRVMVNFVPGYLAKHDSGCAWEWFWMKLTFEPVDESTPCSPQCGWISSIPLNAWPGQKDWEGRIHSLYLHWVMALLWPQPWTQTWIRTRGSVSQAFGLGPHAIGSPGPPACRPQIAGLLSLHDHKCQFFIINLSLYMCRYQHIWCFSAEPCLLQWAGSFTGSQALPSLWRF